VLKNKKPLVILFSGGLASYLLYKELIERHPELIGGMFRLPTIPRQSTQRPRLKPSRLIQRILSAAPAYLWFNLVTEGLYRWAAWLCGHTLEDTARRRGIPVHRADALNDRLMQDLRALRPDYLLNNSGNLLQENILSIPRLGAINFHCAHLPSYRGAANYIWMLANGEKSAVATIHYIDRGLDTGPVIKHSAPVPIAARMTVFRLWYLLRCAAYPGWEPLIPYFRDGRPIPAIPQDSSTAATRSFPDRNALRSLRERGHTLFAARDYWTILRIACSGELPAPS
jgi:hypothetical protein